MVVSAAVVFLVVYQDTGTQLRTEIDQDISGDTIQMLQSRGRAERPEPGANRVRGRALHPRAALQRELHSSVRAHARRGAREQPPRAVWRRPSRSPRRRTSSRSRTSKGPSCWCRTSDTRPRRSPTSGARASSRSSRYVGKVRIIAGAGEPLAQVDRAQHGVARAFVLAGAVVLLLALFASYLAGARVSAPAAPHGRRWRRASMPEISIHAWSIAGDRRDEVRVIADAFNRMLDRLSEAFAGQREFVADASHELRTPLTVIRGQLEVLAAQENPSARGGAHASSSSCWPRSPESRGWSTTCCCSPRPSGPTSCAPRRSTLRRSCTRCGMASA